MTEVVSIKFKNRGKAYYFDPAGLQIHTGDNVIVDTANGMEIAVCSRENHPVEDTAVVHPLRRVLRIATQMDLRTEELNRQREKAAFDICREKIQEHQLDMKLVDVECNFEGNKTTFFFTSDGRVDFRSLVKDLAGILHNRIELRQIGVRDEAKMLGGLGICGRPYCCSQFLDDFHPVSTKMAKIQSLSLNPAKISGSCGRLMCCLRYEQEAYEDLVKKVPKQGAFVETKDGYGTAVQVNLLRSTVKVKLDEDREDVLHEYKSYELASVPGGRPKEGVEPPHVLEYVEPEVEETAEEPEDEWALPTMIVTPVPEEPVSATEDPGGEQERGRSRRRSRGRHKGSKAAGSDTAAIVVPVKEEAIKPKSVTEGAHKAHSKKKSSSHSEQVAAHRHSASPASVDQKPQKVSVQQAAVGEGQAEKKRKSRRRYYHGKKSSSKPSSNS